MARLFRRPPDDLDLLRDAVESLGATSVPGLAAALSWRERRTERALLAELSRPGTPLTYDPSMRVVRWAPPFVEDPLPASGPNPPSLVGAVERPSALPPPPIAASGVKLACPSCHVPLIAAASGSIVVCPNCGRLTTARARDPARPTADPATEGAATPAYGSTPIADRRSQELFAAYVTSKPIPCPRCRTPLRHKGLSEYSCPSCGETVRFVSAPPPASVPSSRPASTETPGPPAGVPVARDDPSASGAALPESPPVASPPAEPTTTAKADPAAVEARPPPSMEPPAARVDIARAYLPPPPLNPPARTPGPRKHGHPRPRASCRAPPRFPG